ncbi:MAG: MBL fold metallo-hydrolase [Acidobacteriota bacterium]
MNRIAPAILILCMVIGASAAQPLTVKTDTIPAEKGPIELTTIRHASFMLVYDGKVIHVDPAGPADYSGRPKADYVLITDVHPDHFDVRRIEMVKKEGTIVVGPTELAAKLPEMQGMANGDKKDLGFMQLEAVPAYNKVRGTPERGAYHPKGRGNGYVVTLGGKRIYISGDTECIPEMESLKNIDVAFVCMNLPYTMDVFEAAYCVAAFRPKIVYPYHHQGQMIYDFRSALKPAKDIEVRLLLWY